MGINGSCDERNAARLQKGKRLASEGSCHAKYYKQQSTKSGLLEICSSARGPWLKDSQLSDWGGIWGGRAWSQDSQGHRKNGVPECAKCPGIGLGSRLQSVRVGAHFMFRVAINREPLHSRGTYSPSRAQQVEKHRETHPSFSEWNCPGSPAGVCEVEVLKRGHVPDIKNTWSQSGWTQFVGKPGRPEWLIAFLCGSLKSGQCEFSAPGLESKV